MLDILYEDEHLLFVDKPPGMVVQRGYDDDEDVLFEHVTEYVGAKGEKAFLLQRLDRGTTGVIFFTKRSEVNSKITRQFEKKEIRKTYLALCEGRLSVEQRIDAPIARIGPIKFGVRPEGKRAITRIIPLRGSGRASLLAVDLMTGRTHQIRVHLAAIDHPLVGDWLYGERNAERPMLHSWECTMTHPVTRTELRVTAPIRHDLLAEALARGLEDLEEAALRGDLARIL